jgi:hypothetical protein
MRRGALNRCSSCLDGRHRADRRATEHALGRERLQEERCEVIILDQHGPAAIDRPPPELIEVGRAIGHQDDLVQHALLLREPFAARAKSQRERKLLLLG